MVDGGLHVIGQSRITWGPSPQGPVQTCSVSVRRVWLCLQENLEGYVQKIFEAIVYSGLTCPITMCEVFYALREAALKHFPGKSDLSSHYV